MSDIRVIPGLPRAVLIMVGLAAATIVVAGLRSISDLLGPVFLALVLTVAAVPLRTALTRRGLPRWAGTLVAIVTVYALVAVLAASFVIAAARFADLVPQYQDELTDVVSNIHGAMTTFGVSQEQIQSVVSAFDLGQLASYVTSFLSGILSLLTNLAFIVTLVLFMSVDSHAFATHLQSSRSQHFGFVEAMESFAKGTRKILPGIHHLRLDRRCARQRVPVHRRCAGCVLVGTARVHHELRSEHRLRPRAHPAGGTGVA